MAHKVLVRLAFLLLLVATLQSQALYLSKFLYCICVFVFVCYAFVCLSFSSFWFLPSKQDRYIGLNHVVSLNHIYYRRFACYFCKYF